MNEIINNCITEVLEVKNDFNGDTRLEEFGVSSIEFIKLIVVLEDEFSIEFEDEALDMSKFQKVSDIYDYVSNKVNV